MHGHVLDLDVSLVPDDYVVIEPIPGLAVIVAQSGSCDEIWVDGGRGRPGIFAQFGVAVVPPLAPGNGDFYQILFATDHPRLAAKLRRLGVRARFTPQLSYEIDDQPALDVNVPKAPKLLMFPFFSNPEIFDQTDLSVIIDAF